MLVTFSADMRVTDTAIMQNLEWIGWEFTKKPQPYTFPNNTDEKINWHDLFLTPPLPGPTDVE